MMKARGGNLGLSWANAKISRSERAPSSYERDITMISERIKGTDRAHPRMGRAHGTS